ncbi:MAG: hypothetical protein JO020_08465 [Chloroflexi bacterium]|nr:hypothetical protein [Chloroflexota bacterium]MBV9894189.1 hypothetical protein [Chloroflexota bacterium]
MPRKPRAAWIGFALLVLSASACVSSAPSAERGRDLFARDFTPAEGLGPLYNATSCVGCHAAPSVGGTGAHGLATVVRVGKLSGDGAFDPMLGHGGPVARAHSVAELGVNCTLNPGVPAGANLTSVRNAPALYGDGRIDAIPDSVILAGAQSPRPDGIQGRPNLLPDGQVGRFGWKGDTSTLRQFVGEAFRNELGITNPIAPADLVPAGACGGDMGTPEADASIVADVVAYLDNLPAPEPSSADPALFTSLGCDSCHVARLGEVPLYSDLLLHDMGRALDDGVVQGSATGHDWRTAPLWGLGQRARYLHDGRAQSLEAAILAHAGEAEPAVQRFRALSADERAALIAFLGTL